MFTANLRNLVYLILIFYSSVGVCGFELFFTFVNGFFIESYPGDRPLIGNCRAGSM